MQEDSSALNRRTARRFAQAAVERGQPLAWFEELYKLAESSDTGCIPWADLRPNPNLACWLDRERVHGAGTRSLVVGCGLGDDAEELSQRGFKVTAFDLSESAISMATSRFPTSAVEYVAADVLRPPDAWAGAFAFVYKATTRPDSLASTRD